MIMEVVFSLFILSLALETALGGVFETDVFNKFFTKKAKKLFSIVAGVALCYFFGFGFLGQFLNGVGVSAASAHFDYILTGLIIARGSNVVNDMLTRIRQVGEKDGKIL